MVVVAVSLLALRSDPVTAAPEKVLGGKCSVVDWGLASGSLACALVAKNKYAYVQISPQSAPKTVATKSVAVAGTGAKTSRKAPAAMGSMQVLKDADNGDLDIVVDGYITDATVLIEKANQFNSPAPPGQRYVLVKVTATYHAGKAKDRMDSFAADLTLYGSMGVERKSYDCSVVTPDAFDTLRALVDGGKLSGNVCFLLPTADAVGPLVLRAAESICFSNCDEAWFKIQ